MTTYALLAAASEPAIHERRTPRASVYVEGEPSRTPVLSEDAF